MMNYEEFKQYVIEHIMEHIPAIWQHFKPEVTEAVKTNEKLDGLVLHQTPTNGPVASPVIYLNHMYEQYENGASLNALLVKAAQAFSSTLNICPTVVKQMEASMDDFKERVTFKLINYEQNKELLSTMPYRRFHDLAVTYRLEVFAGHAYVSSAVISDGLQEKMKCTEEELFQLAKENTRKLNPPCVKTMYEMMCGLTYGTNLEIPPELSADDYMFVITTANGVNGAVGMLYDDLLHELAEKLGADLYILPSSVHEVIVVPDNESMTLEYMADMVHEVNTTQVDLAEQLSNQVYHYDRKTRELTQATNTQYKRLDGQDTEPAEINNVTPMRRRR